MSTRPDGRRVLQITFKRELYDRIFSHCKDLDTPMAVWTRDLILKELARVDTFDNIEPS